MKTKVSNCEMATALLDNDDDSSSSHESDCSDLCSDGNGDSDVEADCQPVAKQRPCKYYNSGRCKDGDACPYWHVCLHAVKGNCRYGSSCKLNHPTGGRSSSRAKNGASHRSTSRDPKPTNGLHYQWQLDDGSGWRDVDNDHIIEAQYCLPHTKSIKIYNTPYGAVSIDFNRMRVYGKNVSVRRLDDGTTTWIWYCTLGHKWRKYEDKDSKGKPSPVTNSDIENRFQSNPTGSFTFNIGGDTLEIRFTEMRQVSKKRKRKVTRRPVYRPPAVTGVSQASRAFQNMSVGSKPQWEFEGHGGNWHVFKHRTECSVTSDDIERKYQQDHGGRMTFTVKGQSYELDFGAMTQASLVTKRKRKIRRVR